MAFDQKDWEARLSKAHMQEEFEALIMELPQREWHELSEEEREFVFMEEKIEAELLALFTPTAKTKDGSTKP